ncbi:Homeobox-like_domain superfamily [Hexamita inflata]|uniref:Homeobox-like domain superfamily n=1 Tax=Hexamita inflata TaxID=28002 RepID=A0AA86QE41_9EUKA|nr:Homeobox-like domain superfamily [Hexamita inflata]
MTDPRIYHKWTDAEVTLLYKTVMTTKRDWYMVHKVFPQLTQMQLQNKFQMIQKQYRKCYHNSTPRSSQSSDTLVQDNVDVQDTINVLLRLVKE